MQLEIPEWKPSAYQQAIYDEVRDGTGHIAVIARAGCAKSTTIMGALDYVRPVGAKVLLCAFGKDIAKELRAHVKRKRLEKSVDVQTSHSVGYAAIRRVWGKKVQLSETKERRILEEVLPAGITNEDRATILKLVEFAKSYVIRSDEELALLMDGEGLSINWTVYTPAPLDLVDADEAFEEEAGPPVPRYGDPDLFDWIRAALDEACRESGEVSYADMVYVPVALGWKTGNWSVIFVDETQDRDRSWGAPRASSGVLHLGSAEELVGG